VLIASSSPGNDPLNPSSSQPSKLKTKQDINSIQPPDRQLRSFHPGSIKNFLHSRCCNAQDTRKTNSIWVYEGYLVDPFNGRRIAEVEGVELVRHLTDNVYCKDNNDIDDEFSKDRDFPDEEDVNISLIEAFKPGNAESYRLTPKQLKKQSSIQKKRLGDLSIKSILFPPKKVVSSPKSTFGKIIDAENVDSTSSSWDYASTILSRKFFCYRDPSDKRKVLSSIRIRPGIGKVRKLKIEETVALYDTATTFISRDNGQELDVHTEWSNGRSILAKADHAAGDKELNSDWGESNHESSILTSLDRGRKKNTFANNEVPINTFEYTVYAKGQRGLSSKATTETPKLGLTKTQLIELNKKKKGDNFDGVTISPPRTRLIQFGSDKVTNDKYGARESYSYSFPSQPLSTSSILSLPFMNNAPAAIKETLTALSHTYNKCSRCIKSKLYADSKYASDDSSSEDSPCVVRYTRYGESPPWYGVGRMCTLELVGKKVSSLQHVPPLIASLAAKNVPGFTSVNYPISSRMTPLNSDGGTKQGYENLNLFFDHKDKEYESAAKKALQWFRDDDENLQIYNHDEEMDFFTRLKERLKKNKSLDRGASILNAIQKATIGS